MGWESIVGLMSTQDRIYLVHDNPEAHRTIESRAVPGLTCHRQRTGTALASVARMRGATLASRGQVQQFCFNSDARRSLAFR